MIDKKKNLAKAVLKDQLTLKSINKETAVHSLVYTRTNDPKAKLMCRWVQSWKYNKMVDSNIILHSKLNLSDKFKKG